MRALRVTWLPNEDHGKSERVLSDLETFAMRPTRQR